MRICLLLLLVAWTISLPIHRALAASPGSLDTTFDAGTGPNFVGTVNAAVAQSDGKVIVAGAFTSFNGVEHVGLVRLNQNGSVDTAFNHGGGFNVAGTVALVLDAAVQSDGKILVAGGFATYDGTPALGLVRLNTDGTVDSGFAQTNIFVSVANSLLPMANGQILVGLYTSPGLIRLNANGSIDTNFFIQPFGPSLNDAVGTIKLQPDGKILVGGKFTKFYNSINDSVGTVRQRIARLNADGTLDTSFDAGAAPVGGNGTVNGFALQSSGKIIVGGDFTNFNGTACGGVIRLTASGAVDGTFTSEPGTTKVLNLGPGLNFRFPGPVFDVTVDPSDRVLLAGSFVQYNLAGCSNVVRLTPNGALDATFVNDGPNNWTSTLFLQPDGKMIISGYFTNVGGFARAGLARLNGTAAPAVAPTIASNPVSMTVTNPVPLTAGDLTETGLRGKILKMHILNGGAPFPAAGDYDIVLAASGNTYSIPAGGAMAASSGTWSFGPDLGIDTVLTLSSSFPGGGGVVKVALLTDGTYEMYADGVMNDQNGTYTRAYLDGTPVGPTVMFTVGANGTMPFAYQWLFEGSPIAPAADAKALAKAAGTVFGANTATLTISNAATENAGKYSVIVTNVAGSVTSAVATLTVNGFSGGPPDAQNPRLTVTAPPVKLKAVGSNTVNFAGTAGDNVGLASVSVSVNGGGFAPVNGLLNWTASVALDAGTNTIRIRAADSAGNAVTNTRVLVFVPALARKGVFNGLFLDTNSPSHASAGAITFSVKPDGKVSGKVRMGNALYAFAGTFGSTFTAQATVPRTGLSTLQLELQFVGDRVEGTVMDGVNWSARLTAYPAKPVGALAGKYTMLIPGSSDPAVFPAGNGFASLTLSAPGRLSGIATLGDGSMIKVLASVSADGHVPFYLSLYGGAGSIFGWLAFDHSTPTEVDGTPFWSKPASVGSPGFAVSVQASGSRYVAPAAGTPALTLTDGVVILRGGNLSAPLTNNITLGVDNKISGDHQLAIVISAPKGTFTGSFVDPASSANRKIKGVIVRAQNLGGGLFPGTDQSGGVFIGERP